MTKKRPNRIRINSIEYVLKYNPKSTGAAFNTNVNGRGIIELGTKLSHSHYVMGNLLHEIIECILTENDLRWKDSYNGKASCVFCFTHEDLVRIVPQIYDALRSIELFNEKKIKQLVKR